MVGVATLTPTVFLTNVVGVKTYIAEIGYGLVEFMAVGTVGRW